MIPLQLQLKNFLSYRDATLDFRGIHVACVCGGNGAGKSSLLEAIAWVIWGQSRANSEDDVIHMGEVEARVDFIFSCHHQTYRVLRTRYRKQSSALEFQIQTGEEFRTLTGRGMKATQQLIQHHIRLDYDTFINSAYLRQGRADEFMLKRPGERKQILADLLKLDQYDDLTERAKERSRHIKTEITMVERAIETAEHHLLDEPALVNQIQQLEATQKLLQQQQEDEQGQLKQLQDDQQRRQAMLQECALIQQQQQHLRQECQRLAQEQATLHHQCLTVERLLSHADQITQTYAQFQALQNEDEQLSQKFQDYQHICERQQTLKKQYENAMTHNQDQLRTIDAQLDALKEQEKEIERTLSKRMQVQTALTQFHEAKAHLITLDQMQTKVSPLVQRKQQIHQQIQQHQIRLRTRLEDIEVSTITLRQQQREHPELHQELISVASQLEYLEKRRQYQQLVRERGTERRAFMERLQERQRELERQLTEVDHKIHWLQENCPQQKDKAEIIRSCYNSDEKSGSSIEVETTQNFPPCPLCDRPLDKEHLQVVLSRHQADHQDIQRKIWVIREQLSASEKEIQILREEYRELDRELSAYEKVLQQQGRLEVQLQSAEENHSQLQLLLEQKAQLECCLHQGDYGAELRDELTTIDEALNQLQYDERTHALARGKVDQLRWAEIKAAEIQQAETRRSRLLDQCTTLETQQNQLHQQRVALETSSLRQELDALAQEIQQTDYDADKHTQMRQELRHLQAAPLQYQEMRRAQQQCPMLQERLQAIAHTLSNTQQSLNTVEAKLTEIDEALIQSPDCNEDISVLGTQIKQRRSQLDMTLSQLGRLHQQQQQFNDLKIQQQEHQHKLQQLTYQNRLYQELVMAFGKNGIQALMIENILPQLEAESNRILGQLSAHQLHIQFVTQRASKSQSRTSRKLAPKLIDTLDILIADTQGTRAYETYSGGEAFRVNFAIRLALARLLAQRSGTALKMLIIDEGFGTQDQSGCDRLVSAINAIAPDFSCILTITHMPYFKEVFQTRIDVTKDVNGSYLNVIS